MSPSASGKTARYNPVQAHTPADQAKPSAAIDLTAPTRAASIDLRDLIAHRSAVQSGDSVETVYRFFEKSPVNFIAVLDGKRLVGMCSRRETFALLGGRYGFSLWARKRIADHLCQRETRIEAAAPIGDVLHTVFARPIENFYDDVLLVDEQSGFLGFVTTETLFQVQNKLLLTNIRDLEEKDREIQGKNDQMETDLRMAMELQQALLPVAYPFFPPDANEETTALRFDHRYLPASLVGGDFFHIARLSDNAAGIFLCDVMGHGVRAALVTAMLRALMEAHRWKAADPGALLTHLNDQFTGILKQTGTLVFATALYCVIDIRHRELRYARAGHPPPLHARRSARDVQPLLSSKDSAGPALGLIKDAQYKTSSTQLAPGDFLLLFTDGVVEVETDAGAQFGLESLRRSVQAALQEPTSVLLDAIVDQVFSFAGSRTLADDVCLVAVELQKR